MSSETVSPNVVSSTTSTATSPSSSPSSRGCATSPSNQSDDALNLVVALEGLIGVGKSTLCRKLTQMYGEGDKLTNAVDAHMVHVLKEETNEQLLSLFYSNPDKYGFTLQWGMLKSRLYQLKLAQLYGSIRSSGGERKQLAKRTNMTFWDRSMVGDHIFALWNHLLGGISGTEMLAYESEFGGSFNDIASFPFLKDIDLFVFLDDEPVLCKERVENGRQNASEQNIPLSYYEGLDDIQFHTVTQLLSKTDSRAIVKRFGEYDEPSVLHAECITAALREQVGARVTIGESLSSVAYSDEPCRVFLTTEDVSAEYERILSMRDQPNRDVDDYDIDETVAVFLPSDIMTIDPFAKSVTPCHAALYGITFYENAFKRVVMFHLSRGRHVHLFASRNM